MANKIILKKTSTASKVPLSTDLEVGEIAVNLADQKLYSKNASGTVVLVGSGLGGSGDVTGGSSSTDNALARYDGTTGKVIQNSTAILDDSGNLDTASIKTDYADLDTGASAPTYAQGRTFWDSGNGTTSTYLNPDVTLQNGQEIVTLVYNGTGSTITNGSVVAVVGAQGQRPSVALADADSEPTSASTLGIATQDIANGAEGFITSFGFIRGVDTSAFTAGAPIYLSQTAGGFTATRPSAPAHTVILGWVIKVNASSGEIFVHINNGWELDELHNVLITSPTSGNTLIYDAVAGVWENANLTDGTGISITEGAGSITIANTGVTSLTGTTNEIDVSASTGSVTLSLPATINANTTGTADNVSGVVAIANGGTGQTTANSALNALLPSQTGNTGKVLSTDGTDTSWIDAGGGSGDVVGPASATDNAVARYDGTTGKLIQNSSVTINDSGTVSAVSVATNNLSSGIALNGDSQAGVISSNNGKPMSFNVNGAQRLRITNDGAFAFGSDSAYGSSGQVLQSNGVSGVPTWVDSGFPASSTDNAIARYNGTTGRLIQNSAVTIDDTTGTINLAGTTSIIKGSSTSFTPIAANANMPISVYPSSTSGNSSGVFCYNSSNTGNTSYIGLNSGGGTPTLSIGSNGTGNVSAFAITFKGSSIIYYDDTFGSTNIGLYRNLRLYGSSSGYVGFAPAANAGSTTYTLPTADGTSGQVLSTNGSGTLSWSSSSGVTSVAAGNGMNFTTITGTGTVTMGTPSSITNTTTNSASGTTHSHALSGELVETTTGSALYYGARAWVSFNGTGTPAIDSSSNVSSISDGGTGVYTINFSTAMPAANYATVTGGSRSGSSSNLGSIQTNGSPATGSVTIWTFSASALIDWVEVSVAIFR